MIEKLHSNSEQILKSRYYIDDNEDWPALCRRAVDNVVPLSCANYSYADEDVQVLSDNMFHLINDLYFLPNSPTLFNAGTDYPMLSACFIIDVEDDLPSIYESVKESALIHKMGGGVGFSLCKLRIRGSSIGTTHGSSSGSVSFLRVFSHASNEITAGGRRKGANMCMLDADHGDILEFLSCKEQEGELSNFNISVAASDEFMDAAIGGGEIGLRDPKDNSIVGTISASDILMKIAHGAWLNGEPGLCFIDTVNRDNPTPHLGKIMSSNPCQPGWATVLTPEGIRTFDDVSVGDVIWSGQRWTTIVDKQNTGVKDVFQYGTRAGIFYGTENHRILQNGKKIEVKDAELIDIAVGPIDSGEDKLRPLEIMDGLVAGDGMYHKASDNVVLLVGDSDQCYFDDADIGGLFIESTSGIKSKSWRVETSFTSLPLTYDRTVPDYIKYGDYVTRRGFLRGLYSANGSIVGRRVSLKASSLEVVTTVQEMLSSIGISSYYTVHPAHDVEFSTGTYLCRESYDLNIGNEEGRLLFRELIGFIHPYKQSKLDEICVENKTTKKSKSSYEILEVIKVSTEEVFDITVDAAEHTYWTGGMLVSNCGEFYNIPYNSCNLGSLNLTKYIKNGDVDWSLLQEHIGFAVEYLDSIIDANMYPLEKISEVTKQTRPIGLGVLGFADMLVLLGIRYDSDEGISMASNIAEFISYHSLRASVELAKTRGKYPAFKAANHRYEKQVEQGMQDWEGLVNLIRRNGLRNSHTMVIAPTGTLARLANERSFGIEPIFATEYESNILDTKQKTRHPLYHEFVEGRLDVPKEVFVTAGEVSWRRHIDMQAAWQVFTHNGISKTINMAEGTSEQDVFDAYVYAYQNGLKGITVYVAGSREHEVLVSTERVRKAGRKPKNINMDVLAKLVEQGMSANELSDIFDCSISTIRRRVKELKMSAELLPDKISRPDELWGPKYRIPSPSGNVYVEIGVDDETGKPLETIVTISKSGSSSNAMAEALGKMISKALQHRMDPYEVIETIKDIQGGDSVGWWRGKAIKSVPDGVAAALFTYMNSYYNKNKVPTKKPGTDMVLNGGSCPKCGEFMMKSEGCEICPNCSYGKCG